MKTAEALPATITPKKEVENKITAGLDYYKPTMSQFVFEHAPKAEATFTLKNRNGARPLAQYVEPDYLQERLNDIRTKGFDDEEVAYLAGLSAQNGDPVFSVRYLDYLSKVKLPEVKITEAAGDLAVHTTGDWPAVTFWETVVMSEISQRYFENMLIEQAINPLEIYEEGDRRLTEKIKLLKSRPDIKIADFGTRRRFSLGWQQHVLERLATEAPDNLFGTSNVYFAQKYGLRPIGTFAHELPMVYAGLYGQTDSELRDSHKRLLDDWYDFYGRHLSVALTDTFSSDFFIETFTKEQALKWRGVRHDSGDPFEFGDKIIDMYKRYGIDPIEKTIVFSDGLDFDKIVQLQDYFKDRIDLTPFGIGTNLTNDLGVRAGNFVMKATMVNDVYTVKLSDNAGKHTGPQSEVDRYERVFAPKFGSKLGQTGCRAVQSPVVLACL